MKNFICLFALILSFVVTSAFAGSCMQRCDQSVEQCYRQCKEGDFNCEEKCEMNRSSCSNDCEDKQNSCRLSCITKYEKCLDSSDWHGEDDLIRCERQFDVCSMKCEPDMV